MSAILRRREFQIEIQRSSVAAIAASGNQHENELNQLR